MPKTPDEIKKGLVEAIEECAWVVEGGDAHDLQDACEMAHASMADALALIQQLQDENEKKDETIQMLQDGNASLMRMIDEECEKTVKLEEERDALHEELKNAHSCFACKKFRRNGGNCCGGSVCMMRDFEWRGVQKEE